MTRLYVTSTDIYKNYPVSLQILTASFGEHNKYAMCWNVGVVQFVITTSRRHSTGIKCHPYFSPSPPPPGLPTFSNFGAMD
jgi:hypothetical protein